MIVQVDIAGSDTQGRSFLTWAPVAATARIVGGGAAGDQVVTVRSAGPVGGLVLGAARTGQGAQNLSLTLPADGSPASFFVAGSFQAPSANYGDAVIEVAASDGTVLASKPTMVRIRKDAKTLSAAERDRYLAALGTLNAKGRGAYQGFRDMHTAASDGEMHGNTGFLPWHRAYVLDLERALQAIDPTVAVPYWRFDQPAPTLFTTDFMGQSDPHDRVVFKPGHPLEGWKTDGGSGITRGLRFRLNAPANVSDETTTMRLGADYTSFRIMEGDPHGYAHTSFRGPINSPPTAVKDPLFFMLHANVDRLWAKWQWVNRREDFRDPDAFEPSDPYRIGHNIGDTMWPWNGITGGPRPPTAPGGPFPASAVTPAPGAQPVVESTFDPLAVMGGDVLAFGYDDVPFEPRPVAVAGGPNS